MERRLGMLFTALVAFAGAACSHESGPARLAPVEPLPSPSLPAWISSISPTRTAQSLAQIRVIFAKPVAAVESLDGDGPRDVLSHLRIEPALKGRFVLLTPRMIGFVPDEALPAATRVRVTVTAGLADLAGERLANDLAWTFSTQSLAFTGLPAATVSPGDPTPSPAALRPTLAIDANAPVDPASLAQHASLVAGSASIPLAAHLRPTPTPDPAMPPDAAEAFGATARTWTYELTPARDLTVSTAYTIRIDPGVLPEVGNVATTQRFTGGFHTYDALAISPTPTPDPSAPSGGRFANGDPLIAFNNPIDATTIAKNVTISPQPSPMPSVGLAGDSSIAIDPYALDPNTEYRVRVGAGLKDVFGQTLASDATVVVHTGDFAPGAWAPSGKTTLPAGAGVDLNFYATNLPRNRYRAAFTNVSALSLLQGVSADSLLPSPAPGWPQHALDGAKTNAQSTVRIDIGRQLGSRYGALAYGFWTSANGEHSAPITGIAQLTDLGVFAQVFPAQATVMVQRLSDGSPVAHASIDAYRLPDEGAPQRCAGGETDADGVLSLSQSSIEQCYAGMTGSSIPHLGFVAAAGGDTATVDLYDWSGIYRYDVPYGWETGAPRGAGTIFPDRNLYQPGERGTFTGAAYIERAGAIRAETNARYTVTLRDPNGDEHAIGAVTTDRYGLFSLPYAFAKAQPLGYYTIRATGPSGATISGTFRVAEFKPPNFKLDVAIDRKSAVAGDRVTATGTAAYLFGAPLARGRDAVTVTRAFASVAPKGWDDFTFGRQWFWPEQQPALTSDVLQRDTTFDASGIAHQTVTVPADLPAPVTYTVEMEASDVSNLSVANAQSFLALPTDAVIGLAADTVASAGTPTAIRIVATDADGKIIAGRNVHLELQHMTYVWASQAVEGGEDAQPSVKYDTVDKTDVISGDAPVTASLRPTDPGSYRIRATFANARDEASATDLQIFATGEGAADFGTTDRSTVRVTLDKKTYRVGDTVNALVGSPYDRADVYLSVVRYGTLYRTVLHNVAGAPRVRFTVTPEMFPNAAVQAVVVRRGAPLGSVKPGALDSLSRTGLSALNVDTADRYLKLAVDPQAATLAPGAEQHVRFTLRDAAGHPARGKIVAMAVNDAILQLSGYRLPDLVAQIYAQQPISTRFSDNRYDLTLKTPQAPSEKGYGYGGGFLEGAAGTRVRTEFRPLAYYGSAATDADGRAEVRFTLPDDLTTWRVMAVAVADDDRRFGRGDATFISSLPVMANALLPQFARTGDIFDGGASVVNGNPGEAQVDLLLKTSGALRFQDGDRTTIQQRSTTPPGLAAYRFPIVAGTPAPSTLAVRASIGVKSDAFSVPFEIRDRETTETTLDANAGRGSIEIPIHATRAGTVTVTLANSVVPQYKNVAMRALAEDGLPTLDDHASRSIVAATIGDDDRATREASQLVRLQRADGGFRYVADARESDTFGSAYALEALAVARGRGIAVDGGAFDRARAYAEALLVHPERDRSCSLQLCRAQVRFAMMWALAQSGERRTEGLDAIVAAQAQFDTPTRIRLARYLLATPGWQAQGRSLSDDLRQNVYLTGRYATADVATPWGWRDQLVDAQAEMLSLLLEARAPLDQIDGAARSLLAQSCACGWPTLETTAGAVRALDAYGRAEPPSAMDVRVTMGAANLGTVSFGSSAQERRFAFPSARITGSSLRISASVGVVHAIVAYTYAVAPDAPGALTAFRVTRTLAKPGETASFARIDLPALHAPLEMAVGNVFDVGIRIAVDRPVDRLAIEDPIPAGFEAVDTTFSTASISTIARTDAWEIGARTIAKDRVTAIARHLGPGVYEMHYLVRSVTPGRYRWPGARAYLIDAPELFGRTASATLILR